MEAAPTTILTLRLDAASQAWFDALRQRHYPAHLNRIPAHLTLFHTLPATPEVRMLLLQEAGAERTFHMSVTAVRSLGRGVAYTVQSKQLAVLQQRLASAFQDVLTPQDRQGFRPHVVVQNKVSGAEAKALLAELAAEFAPRSVVAEGLEWWDYLGGPWRLRERMNFVAAS